MSMRRGIVVACLLVLAATPVYGLTVADVVEMTEAGLGDEVIINQIRATHSWFDLTVDEIIALSNAGVSDAVLSTMIATAFDETSYGTYDAYDYDSYDYDSYEYDDNYSNTRYVVVEDEPDVHTYLHLGVGYHSYPWSYVWWDYWSPSWDYYWYAGDFCRPWWSVHYRPWHHRSYCWHPYDWCGTYTWWDRDHCDRVCHVGSGRSQVRWKSATPALPVTLAGSKTRMKAIRDADRGRTESVLARLEPTRKKSTTSRNLLASKGYRTSGGSVPAAVTKGSKTRASQAASVHALGKRKTSTVGPRVDSRSLSNKKRTAPAHRGSSISKSKVIRSRDKTSSSAHRPAKTWGSSKKKSSGSSSKATKSSVRSKSGSNKSSPARSSRSGSKSGSKSSSGSSKGSKKKR